MDRYKRILVATDFSDINRAVIERAAILAKQDNSELLDALKLQYDEMHVDGGVTSQMFFYPQNMDWGEVMDILDVQGVPTIYLIRNAFAREDYAYQRTIKGEVWQDLSSLIDAENQ